MASSRISRRTFIRDFGTGVLGISIGASALAACGNRRSTPTGDDLEVHRVNMGIASAYLLVRGTTVTIVDTGPLRDTISRRAGSEEVGKALSEVGLGWTDVGVVILTHHHGDHVGSLHKFLDLAPEATIGAGSDDIGLINQRLEQSGTSISRERLVEFQDGLEVAGSMIVSSPGHTPGHLSVWDPATSVLIAGDALNGEDNGSGTEVFEGIGGPTSRRSEDMTTAIESVRKLASFKPETIYFGHGTPKMGNAAAALDQLVGMLSA